MLDLKGWNWKIKRKDKQAKNTNTGRWVTDKSIMDRWVWGVSVKEETACETQDKWMDSWHLLSSMNEVWWYRGALVLVSWEIDTKFKEQEILPFYFTMSCHSLWSALDWFKFHHAIVERFEAYFRAMQNLSGEETESQSTVFGIACIIARFKPQWGPVGQALKCKVREKCPTSQSHLWEVLQNVWVEIFPEYL